MKLKVNIVYMYCKSMANVCEGASGFVVNRPSIGSTRVHIEYLGSDLSLFVDCEGASLGDERTFDYSTINDAEEFCNVLVDSLSLFAARCQAVRAHASSSGDLASMDDSVRGMPSPHSSGASSACASEDDETDDWNSSCIESCEYDSVFPGEPSLHYDWPLSDDVSSAEK